MEIRMVRTGNESKTYIKDKKGHWIDLIETVSLSQNLILKGDFDVEFTVPNSTFASFKVGDTFYLIKGQPFVGYKCHVVGIVDNFYIVYKWYGKHRQWWHYQVKRDDFLQMEIESTKKILDKHKKTR